MVALYIPHQASPYAVNYENIDDFSQKMHSIWTQNYFDRFDFDPWDTFSNDSYCSYYFDNNKEAKEFVKQYH